MAAKYWVGGTGTWSTAGRWSTQTGQASFVATRPTGTNATLTVTQVYSGTITSGHALYDGAGTARGNINAQVTPLLGGESLGGVGRYTTTAASATISTSNQCYTIVNLSNTTVPVVNSTDEIIFDANSGSSPTVTISATAYAGAVYIGSVGTTAAGVTTSAINGTLTLTGTSTLNCYGNLKLPITGLNWTYTGTLTFTGANSRTVVTNSVLFNAAVTFNLSGTVYFADAFTTSNIINFTAGTLDLTNAGASSGVYLTGSGLNLTTGSRYITSGIAGKVVLTAASGAVFGGSTTAIYGLYSILLSATNNTGSRTIAAGVVGHNYIRSIGIAAGGGDVTFGSSLLTSTDNYTIPGMNCPDWAGTFTYAITNTGTGTGSISCDYDYIALNCTVLGLSAASASTVDYRGGINKFNNSQGVWAQVSYVQFGGVTTFNNTAIVCKFMFAKDVNFGATGSITTNAITSVTTISDMSGVSLSGAYTGNKQITINVAATNNANFVNSCYISATDGSQFNVIIQGSAGIVDFKGGYGYLLGCCAPTIPAQSPLNSINFSGYSGTAQGNLLVSGSVALPANLKTTTSLNIYIANTNPATFSCSSTQPLSLNITGSSTVNLLSDVLGLVTVYSGTFNTNNFNIGSSTSATGGLIVPSNGIAKTISLGSSNIYVKYSSSNFPTDNSLVLNAGTSNFILESLGASSSSQLHIQNYTVPKITVIIGRSANYSPVIRANNGTISSFEITGTAGVNEGIQFGGTINFNNFVKPVVSTGYRLSLSAYAGTTPTLNNSSGTAFVIKYVDINNITATPANMWYASNSTNTSSAVNTGWVFGEPSVVVTYNNNQFFAFF